MILSQLMFSDKASKIFLRRRPPNWQPTWCILAHGGQLTLGVKRWICERHTRYTFTLVTKIFLRRYQHESFDMLL